MLTRTAEHALRALLVLARHDSGRPLAAETIAELTGAPANYLGKTLIALARAGLVRSIRGRSGGFVLATSPESITIANIADVFAEPSRARQCLLGTGRCNGEAPCTAHQHWMRLTSAVRAPLTTTTIAALLAGSERAPPIDFRSQTD